MTLRDALLDLVLTIGYSANIDPAEADRLPPDAPPPDGIGDEIWLVLRSEAFRNARKKLESLR